MHLLVAFAKLSNLLFGLPPCMPTAQSNSSRVTLLQLTTAEKLRLQNHLHTLILNTHKSIQKTHLSIPTSFIKSYAAQKTVQLCSCQSFCHNQNRSDTDTLLKCCTSSQIPPLLISSASPSQNGTVPNSSARLSCAKAADVNRHRQTYRAYIHSSNVAISTSLFSPSTHRAQVLSSFAAEGLCRL